jgi:hypothetical protein
MQIFIIHRTRALRISRIFTFDRLFITSIKKLLFFHKSLSSHTQVSNAAHCVRASVKVK